MRALILAAGRGSRMGAATEHGPKGMLEVLGRPLLAWQIDALRAAGASEIAIVRGYRGEALRFDVRYYDNPRWESTNMVASLGCAAEWLRAGPCLVSYADLVYPPEAPRRLAETAAPIALLYDAHWRELWSQRFADPLDDAEALRLDARGRVLEIGGRPRDYARIEGQYMGLFQLTPEGAERLFARSAELEPAARDRLDMTTLFARCVRAGDELHAVRYDGWWCEIDQPSDLALAERIAAQGTAR
ncbi:MAG: phosphocholine cytidylyltransferase family protein [Planctomycetes bacterium]|nr:phosphocholine cytidylyltransferase family protein [Planctomycetota bacterium]